MTRITENTIDAFAIELLHKLGYEYIYAPDIANDSNVSKRTSAQNECYPKFLLLNKIKIGLIPS